jgi:two-component system response regulator AtoC
MPGVAREYSNDAPAAALPAGAGFIPGRSECMRRLLAKIDRIAPLDIPVLIEGETGTGKDVIARLIHGLSLRRSRPFVKVSCPSIPASLLESELFGHEKGAFTGAIRSKPGWAEAAGGGTLFLDEIAELNHAPQAKLLQLLQDGTFFRIGGLEEKSTDLRILAAASRCLATEVDEGRFRRDLFYRINVVTLTVPPLRDRREDIPELASRLLDVYNCRYGCNTRRLSSGTMALLLRHDWPGNVRELENLIRKYAVLGSEEALRAELLENRRVQMQMPLQAPGGPAPLKAQVAEALRKVERDALVRVLDANHWNRKGAARALKISYRTLFYKLRTAGLAAPAGRGAPAQAG